LPACAIENSTWYTNRGDVPEADFVAAIAERADCQVLLDLNNVVVNHKNHGGMDLPTFITRIDPARISYLHVAGHEFDARFGMHIDTHSQPVESGTAAMARLMQQRHQLSVLLEWDNDLPGCDLILSIVPPDAAIGLAQMLAPVLRQSPTKPAFIDFNAINPATMQDVSAALSGTGCDVLDGAIIGLPPQQGRDGPTFYISGDPDGRADVLASFGLKLRQIDGPVGAASALKMVYAGINKGLVALGTAMFLASERAGCAQAPLLLYRWSGNSMSAGVDRGCLLRARAAAFERRVLSLVMPQARLNPLMISGSFIRLAFAVKLWLRLAPSVALN
jgi:hypothetical protein